MKTIKNLENEILVIKQERLQLKRRQAAMRVKEWRLKKAIALINQAHQEPTT